MVRRVNHVEKERKEWYILWSPTDCNVSKVELALKGQDAELWMPVFNQVVGQEKESVPLYPGYYFVNCDEETVEKIEDRITGMKAKGKLVFMKNEDKKLHKLSDEEILRIKTVEEEEVDCATLFEGEKVRMIGGPLKDFEGRVISVKKGFVRIVSQMFNRELDAMWVPETDCEKIN